MNLLLKISATTIGLGSSTAILLILVVLAFCYIKSPKGTVFFLKIAGCILAFVVLPVSAVFSGVKINSYYSAEGGIFGRIRQSLNLNSGKVSTDTFEIEELNLRLDENKEYTATITVNVAEADTVLKLSANKKYCLEVNGALTYNNFTSSTGPTLSISADYTYTFRNFENAEIVKDTLHFAFQVNERTITCRVSSKGTAQAQKLWSRYCDKNGLKIRFFEETYKKPSLPSVGEGDVSDILLLIFKGEDETFTRFIKRGETITQADIPTISKYGYSFSGWSEDGESIFDFGQKIEEDKQFIPIWAEKEMEWKTFQNYNIDPPDKVYRGELLDDSGSTETDKFADYTFRFMKQHSNRRILFRKIAFTASGKCWYVTPDFQLKNVENYWDIPVQEIYLELGQTKEFELNGNTFYLSFSNLETNSDSVVDRIRVYGDDLGYDTVRFRYMEITAFQMYVEKD